MKRIGGVWSRVTDFENLMQAYLKARRGKGHSEGVIRFALDLERELFALQRQLRTGDYLPGAYRLFTLYERKPRQIAAAPFRDRVVHQALMNVIGPPLEARFIHDSYACRPGKGTHAAVDRYQIWARRYAYVMKLDVRRYFPNIDHLLLKQQLRARIKDSRLLEVLDRIIDTSPCESKQPAFFPGDDLLTFIERPTGIPVGNLTSQFFANLYLDDLDHFIKERLRCPAYLRYVDDLVLLADSKAQLRQWRAEIEERMIDLRLRLHANKALVMPVGGGVDLLGYRVFPWRRRLRDDNGHRFARRLRGFARAYAIGRMDWQDFDPSVQSWIGHARHADHLGLAKAIFGATVFRRRA